MNGGFHFEYGRDLTSRTNLTPKDLSSPMKSTTLPDLLLVIVSRNGKYRLFENEFDRFYSYNRYSLLDVETVDESLESLPTASRKVERRKTSNISHKAKTLMKNVSSLEIYNINLFGRESQFISHSKHISRTEVKKHVKQYAGRLLNTTLVITCNGKVNFDVIYPSDLVRVEVGLLGGGGGRGRRKTDIHPGRGCLECFICSDKLSFSESYCHLNTNIQLGKFNFVNYVRSQHEDILDDSCICRRCEKKMQRDMLNASASSSGPSPSKKARTECGAKQHLGFSDCDSDNIRSEWNLQTVAAGLKCQAEPLSMTDHLSLCRKHYHLVYDFIKIGVLNAVHVVLIWGENTLLQSNIASHF